MQQIKTRLFALPFVLLALLPQTALADITQTFKTTGPVVVGEMVSLTGGSAGDTVAATTTGSLAALYGVVVESGDGIAQVATSAVVQVLVSDQNGDITDGSPITASDISGVGEKATISTRIIGLARGTFNAKLPGVTVRTLTDTSGKTRHVAFGAVPVLLGVSYYVAGAVPDGGVANSWVPPAFQSFANKVAGHNVPPDRILLSLFVLVLTIVVVGMIVGTSVHASLISIGRNPLASKRLLKGLAQVVVVTMALIAGVLGADFFILTH